MLMVAQVGLMDYQLYYQLKIPGEETFYNNTNTTTTNNNKKKKKSDS